MTKLVERMLEAMRTLSDEEQDAVARDVLAKISADAEWETLLTTEASQKWLENAANEALKLHADGVTLSYDPSDKPPA